MLQTFLSTFWQALYQDVKTNPNSIHALEIQNLQLGQELSDQAINSLLGNNNAIANLLRYEPSLKFNQDVINLFLKKLPYFELLQANPVSSVELNKKNILVDNILYRYSNDFTQILDQNLRESQAYQPVQEEPVLPEPQLLRPTQVTQPLQTLQESDLPELQQLTLEPQSLLASQAPQTFNNQQNQDTPTQFTLNVQAQVKPQNDQMAFGLETTEQEFITRQTTDNTLIAINDLPVKDSSLNSGFHQVNNGNQVTAALNIQQAKNNFRLQQEKRLQQLQNIQQMQKLQQLQQMQVQQQQMARASMQKRKNSTSAVSKYLKRFVAASLIGGTATVSGVTAFQTLFL